MTVLRIDEPRVRLPLAQPGWAAFTAMAFRPLYLAAALFGAISTLAWVLGFAGSSALPGILWHGHEMIWGYAGAAVVGFLLTASATWTGHRTLSGTPLAVLVAVWSSARIAAAVETGTPIITGTLSAGFLLLSAVALAVPVVRSRNRRNYGLVILLLAFALTDGLFLLASSARVAIDPLRVLQAGLLMVAGFIGVIGLRVIPFFTHRALGRPQLTHPRRMGLAAIAAPLLMAAMLVLGIASPIALPVGIGGMLLNLCLLWRNSHSGLLRQPLLWILYVGYSLTALGLGVTGAALALPQHPWLIQAATHIIAVGGIGTLTLGMMTRTALGHTGRRLELPSDQLPAYALMLLATVLRVMAALPGASPELVTLAGFAFAAALVLFVLRYGRWLVSTRADGLPG